MQNNTATVPAPDLTPAQAAAWFGYKDTDSFLSYAKTNGVPHERRNKRVIRFPQEEVREWKKKRSLNLV